jgi:hypothetical protein
MERNASDEHVFLSTKGKRRETGSNVFAAAVKHIGLNQKITDRRGKFVFHSLRYTLSAAQVKDNAQRI